jgi:hypothetical protein
MRLLEHQDRARRRGTLEPGVERPQLPISPQQKLLLLGKFLGRGRRLDFLPRLSAAKTGLSPRRRRRRGCLTLRPSKSILTPTKLAFPRVWC